MKLNGKFNLSESIAQEKHANHTISHISNSLLFILCSAWFYCKACHDDIKDETLIKKCKCKNCKYYPNYFYRMFLFRQMRSKNHNYIEFILSCVTSNVNKLI